MMFCWGLSGWRLQSFRRRRFKYLAVDQSEGRCWLGQTPIRDSGLWADAGKEKPFLGWYYSPSAEITLATSYMRLESDYAHSDVF